MEIDIGTMKKNFEKDVAEVIRDGKKITFWKRVLYLILYFSIGIFIGVNIGLFFSSPVQINSVFIGFYSIIIAFIVGYASYMIAWESNKMEKIVWRYIEIRFNSVMQYLYLIEDKIPPKEDNSVDKSDNNHLKRE